MGPEFEITIQLQNTTMQTLMNLMLVTEANPKIYSIKAPSHHIALLVPKYTFLVPIQVKCIAPLQSDTIKVSVLSPETSRPVITALVQMPAAEASLTEE
jgi:hypothetical protein